MQESRTSTYLESQSDSVAESDLNVTISEAMRTRDHSEKPCTVLLNCMDMCCYNKHPDQAELFRIKQRKYDRVEQQEHAMTLSMGSDDELFDNSSGRRYR